MEQPGDGCPPPQPAQRPSAPAASFASLVAQDIAALQARFPPREYTDAEKAENVKTLKRRRAERARATQDEVAATGIRPDPAILSGRMGLDEDDKDVRSGGGDEDEPAYSDSESSALPERKKARVCNCDGEAPAEDEEAKLNAAMDAVAQRLPETVIGAMSGLTIIPRAAFLGIPRAVLCQSPARRPAAGRIDLIASLSASHELALELAKHMRPRDIVSLYATSRDFHHTLDTNLGKNVIDIAAAQFPEGSRIFRWRLYACLCVPDPAGRLKGAPPEDYMPLLQPLPWQKEREALSEAVRKSKEKKKEEAVAAAIGQGQGPGRGQPDGTVRQVPSLRWLLMLDSRSRAVRDILAVLARQGLRMPWHAHLSLKKLWAVLDCGYNDGRLVLLQTRRWFTDADLFNCQMFYVKLNMHFNDPAYGPGNQALARLLLGQRGGLHCLWLLLRRKAFVDDPLEIAAMKVRYDYRPPGPVGPGPILGVGPADVGAGHREGWGVGRRHLLRPDQFVPQEATRRGIALDRMAIDMVLYGHVDVARREMLCPTEEEMYMSDDEEDEEDDDDDDDDDAAAAAAGSLPRPEKDKGGRKRRRGAARGAARGPCGNVPFRADDWLPRHAAKKRWATLSKVEKLQIKAAEEQERLRDLVYERDSGLFPLGLEGGGGGGGGGGGTQEASVSEIVDQVLALYGFEPIPGASPEEQAALAAGDADCAMDLGEDDAEEEEEEEDDDEEGEDGQGGGLMTVEEWDALAERVGLDALDGAVEPGVDARDPDGEVKMSTYDFRQF